jgi:hypothetical protein
MICAETASSIMICPFPATHRRALSAYAARYCLAPINRPTQIRQIGVFAGVFWRGMGWRCGNAGGHGSRRSPAHTAAAAPAMPPV